MFNFGKMLFSVTALSAMIVTFGAQAMERNEDELNNSISPSQQNKPLSKSLAPNQVLLDLQKRIGYQFKNIAFLELALRHQDTDIGHSPSSRGYERLEFFGDAVLELVMRELLWNEFPQLNNGDLRNICSTLVDSERLAHISNQLELPQLSKRLKLANFRDSTSLDSHDKADFIESLMGALYYDGGMAASKAFVQCFWRSEKAPDGIRDIFNPLTRSLEQKVAKGGNLLSQPLLRRLYFVKDQSSSLEFLGDGVLRFVLRDLLYKRFPEYTEGQLVEKYDILISNNSINGICKSFDLEQDGKYLKTFIGSLYLDGGLEKTSNYILWHWMSKKAPKRIRAALKKGNGSSKTTTSTILPACFKDLPPPKNLLLELLKIVDENPVYKFTQEGEQHQPIFTTTLESALIGEFKAINKSKKDSEKNAILAALENLSAHVYSQIHLDAKQLQEGKSINMALATLESRLMLLGFKDFSYHVLATQPQEAQKTFRIEIEGKSIASAHGEGETPESAKLRAISNALKKLLKAEYQKVERAIISEFKSTEIRDDLLSFYLLACEKIIHAKGFKPSYEPVLKSKEKITPLLTYQIACESFPPVEGNGFTPLQAQLSAAIKLIDKLMPRRKVKDEEDGKEKLFIGNLTSSSLILSISEKDSRTAVPQRIDVMTNSRNSQTVLENNNRKKQNNRSKQANNQINQKNKTNKKKMVQKNNQVNQHNGKNRNNNQMNQTNGEQNSMTTS